MIRAALFNVRAALFLDADLVVSFGSTPRV
jgi:hypothetical protein